MIDRGAYRAISCGLYVVSSSDRAKPVGCVINTFLQVTSSPAQVSIAINKENVTAQAIDKTKAFEVSLLDEETPMELIGTFGFHSSADTDKFDEWENSKSEQNLTYLTQNTVAHFSARVVNQIDLGTHLLFIGEVLAAEVLSEKSPMSYAYYHQVKGGKTPPKASSYNGGESGEAKAQNATEKKVAWRCTICGHIEYVDELPDDYVCPICGVGKEKFEKIFVD